MEKMIMKFYTRREFLQAAGVGLAVVTASQGIGISDALAMGAKIPAGADPAARLPSPIKGVVSIGSKVCVGVAVSDGFEVVLTDAKGRYSIANKNGDAAFVFVVVPNDAAKSSTAFFRMPFQLEAGQKRIDFVLAPAGAGQSMTKTRFVQITDIHTTDAARGQEQHKGLEEIHGLPGGVDFITATGDLVEHWGQAEEFSNYMEPARKSPIPYFNTIGNHDVSKGANPSENYRRHIQPDYYSFDNGGVHFVILNSVMPSYRQSAWFEKDLAICGKGKQVVVFQHYPPTSEELRKFDKLNIHSVFTGHWHSERVVKSEKTISVTTTSFDMGGIDFTPAGYKVVDISADGTMKTQFRPIGVSRWAKIVWPAGLLCKPQREIIANVYDSSFDAKKVNFKLNQNGEMKASGELKQKSPLSWSAPLLDLLEVGDAELEIEVEGQPQWKAKSSFNASKCNVPEIKTAGDWPMFMGNPSHTGNADGQLSAGQEPPYLAWNTNTDGDIDFSSPILAEGKLFVAVKSRSSDAFSGVIAIEPATGEILWRYKTEQSVNHSPAYEAGMVCVVEVGGRVYGICAANGKEIWRHDLGDNIGRWIYGAPAADEGKFYVGSVNRFARIDARTGKADWEKRLADGADNDWISTPVSPAVSGKYLAMGGFWIGGDNLFVMDKETGERIWAHAADKGMHSSPTIAGDKILFYGKASLLHCCDLSDGKLIWTKQLSGGWSATTPAVKGDIIITGSGDGVMTALKLSDGSEIWTHKSGKSIFKISPYRTDNASVLSSATIAGDKVFFASADGKIYCVDFEMGKELWSFDFGAPVLSTPMVSGNACFVAAYDGGVYAFSGEREKDIMQCLNERKNNENCHWQRPCRFYLQRGNQEIFDRTGSYS